MFIQGPQLPAGEQLPHHIFFPAGKNPADFSDRTQIAVSAGIGNNYRNPVSRDCRTDPGCRDENCFRTSPVHKAETTGRSSKNSFHFRNPVSGLILFFHYFQLLQYISLFADLLKLYFCSMQNAIGFRKKIFILHG